MAMAFEMKCEIQSIASSTSSAHKWDNQIKSNPTRRRRRTRRETHAIFFVLNWLVTLEWRFCV